MKTLRLETATISNQDTLYKALDGLMRYPDWYGRKCTDWLDLISYFDYSPSTEKRKIRKTGREHFIIEIVNAELFWSKEPKLANTLIKVIAEVNKRYGERTGHSLVTLSLLP